jgi:hypothetical protein
MAYFVVSEKVSNQWKELEPLKLDLRTPTGQKQLRELEETHELVERVPENKVGIRVYALIQGQLFWTNKLATLKTRTLRLAIEERMAAKRLLELLTPRAHGGRRGFIEERIEAEN